MPSELAAARRLIGFPDCEPNNPDDFGITVGGTPLPPLGTVLFGSASRLWFSLLDLHVSVYLSRGVCIAPIYTLVSRSGFGCGSDVRTGWALPCSSVWDGLHVVVCGCLELSCDAKHCHGDRVRVDDNPVR